MNKLKKAVLSSTNIITIGLFLIALVPLYSLTVNKLSTSTFVDPQSPKKAKPLLITDSSNLPASLGKWTMIFLARLCLLFRLCGRNGRLKPFSVRWILATQNKVCTSFTATPQRSVQLWTRRFLVNICCAQINRVRWICCQFSTRAFLISRRINWQRARRLAILLRRVNRSLTTSYRLSAICCA